MKRPAFQFYPADWRKDMALQSCSVAARGLWVDMLCIAHECEPYGHLTVNGRPMTAAQIGRHTGLTERECAKLIAELEDSGVLSRTAEGAIFSRRMVRDEDVRTRRAEGGKAGSEFGSLGAEHGKKGGRPRKETGDKKPPFQPPLEPPPSSSSSSSSSEITPQPPEGVGFARFWSAWPAGGRKAAREQCERKWQAKGCEAIADRVLASLEAWKASPEWAKDGGAFIPAPLVWLNQSRWEATPGAVATSSVWAGAE